MPYRAVEIQWDFQMLSIDAFHDDESHCYSLIHNFIVSIVREFHVNGQLLNVFASHIIYFATYSACCFIVSIIKFQWIRRIRVLKRNKRHTNLTGLFTSNVYWKELKNKVKVRGIWWFFCDIYCVKKSFHAVIHFYKVLVFSLLHVSILKSFQILYKNYRRLSISTHKFTNKNIFTFYVESFANNRIIVTKF